MKKTCGECTKKLPIEQFSIRRKLTRRGDPYLNSYCKACMTERTKAWRKKNYDKFLTYQRAYSRMKYRELKSLKHDA